MAKSTKAADQSVTTGAKVEKIAAGKGSKAGASKKSTTKSKADADKATKPKSAPKAGQDKPAKGAAAQGQRGRSSEYPLETKVKANDVEFREGTFVGKVMALADKPITLGDLVEKCVAKRNDFFRSSAAASSAEAARREITLRIRFYIRSEYFVVV